MMPPKLLSERSTKVKDSYEGSIFRPSWSAITLGSMLTDAPVSQSAWGNSMPFTTHGISNFPGSHFFFNVIFSFILSLT
ncbi:hypothetical protein Bca101_006197 [Brassica carinata]